MGQVLTVFLLGGVGDQYGCIVNMYLLEGQLDYRLSPEARVHIIQDLYDFAPPPYLWITVFQTPNNER